MLKITGRSVPPPPRLAMFGKLIEPQSCGTIDHALTLWFPGKAIIIILAKL